MELQLLADAAFDAIKENSGEEFAHSTVSEAFQSFQEITETKGIVWLIDNTKGTGMSHLSWCGWMSEAREQIGD